MHARVYGEGLVRPHLSVVMHGLIQVQQGAAHQLCVRHHGSVHDHAMPGMQQTKQVSPGDMHATNPSKHHLTLHQPHGMTKDAALALSKTPAGQARPVRTAGRSSPWWRA